MEVKLPKIRCTVCGHEWTPRNEVVKKCPRCQVICNCQSETLNAVLEEAIEHEKMGH
jgi:hypothetical protein